MLLNPIDFTFCRRLVTCGQIWAPAMTSCPFWARPIAAPSPKPEPAPMINIRFLLIDYIPTKIGGQGLHQRAIPLARKCNSQVTSQFAIMFAEFLCAGCHLVPLKNQSEIY